MYVFSRYLNSHRLRWFDWASIRDGGTICARLQPIAGSLANILYPLHSMREIVHLQTGQVSTFSLIPNFLYWSWSLVWQPNRYVFSMIKSPFRLLFSITSAPLWLWPVLCWHLSFTRRQILGSRFRRAWYWKGWLVSRLILPAVRAKTDYYRVATQVQGD